MMGLWKKKSTGKEADTIRADFPLLVAQDIAYLDSGATAHKPLVVLEAERTYYESMNANVHRGIYPLAEESTQAYEDSRASIAKFFSARDDEIIFTSGATHALNLATHILETALGITKGDEIVTTIAEHHSLFLPLQQLALRTGAKFVVVPLTNGTITEKSVNDAVTPRTKIIGIAHASNVLGYTLELRSIKKQRATLLVDACQSVVHTSVALGHADMLAMSGHKTYGPMGTGCLIAKRALLEKGEPLFYGGSMIEHVAVETSTWAKPPSRYEAGTPNVAGAVGLAAALAYYKKRASSAHAREIELTKLAEKVLRGHGATILGPAEGKRSAPIISFTLPNVHAHDVAQILGSHGVCVRAGQHCAQPLHEALGIEASVRVTIGMYNTADDIAKLDSALTSVKKVFK